MSAANVMLLYPPPPLPRFSLSSQGFLQAVFLRLSEGAALHAGVRAGYPSALRGFRG